MTTRLINRRRFLSTLSGAAILGLSGWAASRGDVGHALISTRKTSALTEHPPLPPERSAAAAVGPYKAVAFDLVVDTTSSTLADLANDAKTRAADLIDRLFGPGQGPVFSFVNEIGPDSFAPRRGLLSFRQPPVPNQPSRRQTKARPPEPDYSACQKQTFGKQRCIADLDASYQASLSAVLADEAQAQQEYLDKLQTFDGILAAARANVKEQTDQIRALAMHPTDVASDILGALLVAGQNLASVQADFKLLLVQSDLIPFGPQSSGNLALDGVHVALIDWDARDSAEAGHLRQLWEARFRAAGAASVRFLSPAITAITDLLEVQ